MKTPREIERTACALQVAKRITVESYLTVMSQTNIEACGGISRNYLINYT